MREDEGEDRRAAHECRVMFILKTPVFTAFTNNYFI